MNRQQTKKLKAKQVKQKITQNRMKRGDERKKARLEAQLANQKPKKVVSQARQARLALNDLTNEELPSLISDKILYSKVFDKLYAEVSKNDFYRDGKELDYGVKVSFPDENSNRVHYFGLNVIPNPYSETGTAIQIFYRLTHQERDISCLQEKTVNSKKFAARTLLDMIGEYK